MIPSLEKVHTASNNLGYEGPLSSIWGISEGPAQLQSISRDLFRPLLGLTSAELSPMSGHTLLCSRAPPTHRSPSQPVSLSITPQGPKLTPHYWQCLGGHLFFSGPISYSSLQLPTGPGKAASPGGKPCSHQYLAGEVLITLKAVLATRESPMWLNFCWGMVPLFLLALFSHVPLLLINPKVP